MEIFSALIKNKLDFLFNKFLSIHIPHMGFVLYMLMFVNGTLPQMVAVVLVGSSALKKFQQIFTKNISI